MMEPECKKNRFKEIYRVKANVISMLISQSGILSILQYLFSRTTNLQAAIAVEQKTLKESYEKIELNRSHVTAVVMN